MMAGVFALAALFLFSAAPPLQGPPYTAALAEARGLQAAGSLAQAHKIYLSLLDRIRAAGDRATLAKVLDDAAAIETSLADYEAAIRTGEEAAALCRELGDRRCAAHSLNNVGLCHLYRAEYAAALRYFEQSMELSRAAGDQEQEIYRLNNIGNVYYYQGRYGDALRAYQAGRDRAPAGGEAWRASALRFTEMNLASLYLRLGRNEPALALYRSLRAARAALSGAEQGYLLANLGVLYRRLGDPYKAMDAYREAERIFARERHVEGQIGALRNLGITLAMDLGRYPEALRYLSQALALAQARRNRREAMQVRLYRGEVLYRQRAYGAARAQWQTALQEARALGTAEEEWKALYGLGRVANAAGERQQARDCYNRAVSRIESVRSSLSAPGLKREFFGDKREVYDALAAALLDESGGMDAVLHVVERARARTLQEQARAARGQPLTLRDLQARLNASTLLLFFWAARRDGALLWITHSAAGMARRAVSERDVRSLLEALEAPPGADWRGPALRLGSELLADIPPLRDHSIRTLVVVPDGALSLVPFEVLPYGGELLIQRFAVFYLPAAGLLPSGPRQPEFRPPWAAELLAFGDPLGAGSHGAMLDERWGALPHSAEEVRAIARVLTGRAEVHTGAAARKAVLVAASGRDLPVLHLGTHAAADEEDPARSRLLFAGDEYAFLPEIAGLDWSRVDLVTLSACDTERGKLLRGEGVQSFGHAFLAAGARSSVTTLWRVADDATAAFMKRFYSGLARGAGKGAALRDAKLQFLGSGGPWAHPYYWAAFVLNGDGFAPIPRGMAWSVPLLVVAAALAAAAIPWRRLAARARSRQASASR